MLKFAIAALLSIFTFVLVQSACAQVKVKEEPYVSEWHIECYPHARDEKFRDFHSILSAQMRKRIEQGEVIKWNVPNNGFAVYGQCDAFEWIVNVLSRKKALPPPKKQGGT